MAAFTDAQLVQIRIEQRQNLHALEASFTNSMRPLLTQFEEMTLALKHQTHMLHPFTSNAHTPAYHPGTSLGSSAIRISATVASQRCPVTCSCQCHVRTSIRSPPWLRRVFGQLLWEYNSSMSMKPCNYNPCRKSGGKHHFTYYFPPWLISRAIIASADFGDLFGAGATVMINISPVVPKEDEIVWSLVVAGDIGKLRHLILHDKNLMHVRHRWGQLIMEVSTTLRPLTPFTSSTCPAPLWVQVSMTGTD